MIPPDVHTYFLKWRYYFQEYIPATPNKTASHLHLKHWVFLIDAIVNDYEDNAHYGEASIGKLEARLTGKDIGLEEVPANFSTITWFVMTPHFHAPNSIREELWNEDTGDYMQYIRFIWIQRTVRQTHLSMRHRTSPYLHAFMAIKRASNFRFNLHNEFACRQVREQHV